MSNRMKYGPRFKGSAVSVGYHYDEAIAGVTRRDQNRMNAILQHQPQYKQELRHYKTNEKNSKRLTAIRNKNHRYEAEQRMEEAIRKAVAMLEFHMSDLMEHTYTSARPKLVDQNNIHNVIVLLRKKCGVAFENDLHYDHPIKIDHGGGCETIEQRSERHKAEMAEQKLYRLRSIKEMAERFVKFKEAHNGNRDEN
jgi:hypothetical protein